jgi:hypothetical protein
LEGHLHLQALTEDDETYVEPIGCDLGQEIYQSLPVFLSGLLHIKFNCVTSAQCCSKRSYRSIRCTIEEAAKVTETFVEGTKGTNPLSKLNGIETASTVMPA